MSNASLMVQKVFLGVAVVAIAITAGVFLSDPMSRDSMAAILLGLLVLVSPLVLRYSHLALIGLWNASIIFFFLPGQPTAWMPVAVCALGILVLQRIMNKKVGFLETRPLKLPLILFSGIVVFTLWYRGGIGMRILGSETQGGKRDIMVLLAVVGFFAIASQAVPRERRWMYLALFLLGPCTSAIGTIATYVGGAAEALNLIFPADRLVAMGDSSGFMGFKRLGGFAVAAIACCAFIQARFGVAGLLNLQHPWRLVSFLGFAALGALGGFRSSIILTGMMFVVQFWLEGLWRTKWLPIFLGVSVFAGILLVGFAEKMPLPVQRSLAFLPVEIDPAARIDAEASSLWRIAVWRAVLPEVPQYLWIGKGHGLDSTQLELARYQVGRYFESDIQPAIIAGDYHQGILTTIIPYSVFGLGAFLWFAIAGWKILHRAFRHGDEELRSINTFLYAYYIVRLTYFVFVYGHLYADFYVFCGILAFSISLNRGPVRIKKAENVRSEASDPVALPSFSVRTS